MAQRIRTCVVGVGNCASSLVQLVAAAAVGQDFGGAGVMHDMVGPYAVGAVEIVAAFDVDRRKTGTDVADAIRCEPNCTTLYYDVPALGVTVQPGPLADGVDGPHAVQVQIDDAARTATVDQVADALREAEVDVVVAFLPVGSGKAMALYAQAALDAGAAFVNPTPAMLARDDGWRQRFADAGLPLLGDDLKSQLGATTLHRALLDLCREKAVSLRSSYQLNVGGNTDFLNMLDLDRAAEKRATKRGALVAMGIDPDVVTAGPSDYVPSLRDRKVAYLRIEGDLLLGMPFSIEVRLDVEDSPNAAGVVIDAVRAARVARDRGVAGVVDDVCPFLFKDPPTRAGYRDERQRFDAFVRAEPAP